MFVVRFNGYSYATISIQRTIITNLNAFNFKPCIFLISSFLFIRSSNLENAIKSNMRGVIRNYSVCPKINLHEK